MPHVRRNGRYLLAMTGMVVVSLSFGCMRASNLRSPAATLPDLTPAGDLHTAPGGSPTPPSAPRSSSWSRPSSSANPSMSTRRPPLDPNAKPAASETEDEPTVPTPLLDAQIQRVQAVNREQIAALAAGDAPAPLSDPAAPTPLPATSPSPASIEPAPRPTPAPAATATEPKSPDHDEIAPMPLAASSPSPPMDEPQPEPSPLDPPPSSSPEPAGIAIPNLIPIDPEPLASSSAPGPMPVILGLDVELKETGPSSDSAIAIAQATEVATRPEPASGSGSGNQDDAHPTMEIAAMRLCSRVKDFGALEPINAGAIRPGQRARLYCEMNGLEYQPLAARFLSLLAAHIELRQGRDGPVVWEQTPDIARDDTAQPRRDYYVSYLIEFPGKLEPGIYTLRLVQTDLIGRRSASREIPVTIVR